VNQNQTEVVKFLSYLSNPNALSSSDLSEIKDWIAKYPYSQSLKFIVLPAAQKDTNYPDLLAQAATIAPSRKLLYDFIHQPESFKSAVLPFNLENNQTIDERQIAVAQEEGNPVIEHQSNLAFGIDINEIFGSDFKPDKVKEEKNEVISASAEKEIEEEIQDTESKLKTENTEEESEVEIIEQEVLVLVDDESTEAIQEETLVENIDEESVEKEVTTSVDDETLGEIAQESSIENIEEEISVSVEDKSVEEIQKEIPIENIEEEIVKEEVTDAVENESLEETEQEFLIENIVEEIVKEKVLEAVEDEPLEEIEKESLIENIEEESVEKEVTASVNDGSSEEIQEETKVEPLIENIEEEIVKEKVLEVVEDEPLEANQEETLVENIEEEIVDKKVLEAVEDEPSEEIQEEARVEPLIENIEEEIVEEEVLASVDDESLEEIKETEEEPVIENIEKEVLEVVEDEPLEAIQEEPVIENIEEEIVEEEVTTSANDEPLEEIKEEFSIENNEEEIVEIEKVTQKETPVFQYSTQTDFFALNRKDKAEQKQVVVGEIKDESVSAYNDESLPYTFLWWLNKTRKEHAVNNQPYHSFKLDTSKQIKIQQSDGLNHQIAENIFHLRGVENLGSKETNFTVPFDFRTKEFQIIDKFIKEEPQIRPPAANKIDSENKAKKSSEDANQVVSETLAKIYVEQMLYHKALDVYKKLSLKFPEKSTYFASQIKYLELKVN